VSSWQLDPKAAFVHYTPNETIHGVEFHASPTSATCRWWPTSPRACCREPVDVSRFGVIYGGAQKNLGPAGIAIAIVRKDLLGKHGRDLPPIFDLANQAKNDSMFNTPPTLSWYIVGLVLQWLKEQGGAPAIGARNARKAELLYAPSTAPAASTATTVDPAARSRMNVPFVLPDAALDKPFLKEAERRACSA
jgi:phosphoserine aminotransferase